MPVLGTKLHLPSPRRALVQRARLVDRVRADGGARSRLVLVAAPAGFGKTTLLVQWLAAEPERRVAWLALDSGDADLRRFLTNLVAAIQTAEPEAGVEALALLDAGGTTPTDAVLVSLINDLDVVADHVIAPILAGIRRPGPGRPPKTYTRIDRDYDTLRAGMRTLFDDLAINAAA